MRQYFINLNTGKSHVQNCKKKKKNNTFTGTPFTLSTDAYK